MRALFLLSSLSLAAVLSACGGDSTCQSGPKYGTQCYRNDVPATVNQSQPTSQPAQTPPPTMPTAPAR